MLCSAEKNEDDTFKYVPPELITKYPNPATYVGEKYLLFGERPSNESDFEILNIEAMGLKELEFDEGLTLDEFDAITMQLMQSEPTGKLVYFSRIQIERLYEQFKPEETNTP